MGFFKKLLSKISKKQPDIVEKIQEQNTINRKVEIKEDKKKYEVGLKSSSKKLSTIINEMAAKHRKIDEKLFNDIEEMLIGYDVGTVTTKKIIEEIKSEVKIQAVQDINLIKEIIVDKLFISYINNSTVSTSLNLQPNRTNVFILVGVNGVGKTTTIAKLAKLFKDNHKKVMIIAGDTFRAGAVAQLDIWASRVGVEIVKPIKDGQDPSSVIFDGIKKATEEKYDVVICDTAGRLQNKVNLMNELKKINGVIQRYEPSAPHEVLLVLDATTGQSGLLQAQGFNEVTKLTGIVLTKMDGSSKGGIILAIKDAFNLPVKLLGLGEGLDDLKYFDLEKYIDTITAEIGFSVSTSK